MNRLLSILEAIAFAISFTLAMLAITALAAFTVFMLPFIWFIESRKEHSE